MDNVQKHNICSRPTVHHALPVATGRRDSSGGIDPRQGKEIFLFTKMSTPALGPPSLLFSGYRGLRVNRLGHEAVHSPPSSAEVVKNGRAIPPLSRTSSWPCAKLINHRYNFILHLSVATSRAAKFCGTRRPQISDATVSSFC
jgi:hypothetical protein